MHQARRSTPCTFTGTHVCKPGVFVGMCISTSAGECAPATEACLDSLCVTGCACAYFIIAWLSRVSISVAHTCADHAGNSLEGKLWAPEAASCKCGLLQAGWLHTNSQAKSGLEHNTLMFQTKSDTCSKGQDDMLNACHRNQLRTMTLPFSCTTQVGCVKSGLLSVYSDSTSSHATED